MPLLLRKKLPVLLLYKNSEQWEYQFKSSPQAGEKAQDQTTKLPVLMRSQTSLHQEEFGHQTQDGQEK